jgi:hypothetical protein
VIDGVQHSPVLPSSLCRQRYFDRAPVSTHLEVLKMDMVRMNWDGEVEVREAISDRVVNVAKWSLVRAL